MSGSIQLSGGVLFPVSFENIFFHSVISWKGYVSHDWLLIGYNQVTLEVCGISKTKHGWTWSVLGWEIEIPGVVDFGCDIWKNIAVEKVTDYWIHPCRAFECYPLSCVCVWWVFLQVCRFPDFTKHRNAGPSWIRVCETRWGFRGYVKKHDNCHLPLGSASTPHACRLAGNILHTHRLADFHKDVCANKSGLRLSPHLHMVRYLLFCCCLISIVECNWREFICRIVVFVRA